MTTRAEPTVLLFDVNETLLDLRPVRESVAAALGGRSELVALWFTTLLHHSLVSTLGDRFVGFGEIAVATLRMVASSHELTLDEAAARAALAPLTALPAHPDVVPAFEQLREAGFRLAVLTNSARAALSTQMRVSGLDRLLEACYSVEEVGLYKPHPHTYRWAAQRLGVAPESCMMIAAHGWDVAGAAWAGLHTGFVARPGQVLYPLAPRPTLVAADLLGMAQNLVASRAAR